METNNQEREASCSEEIELYSCLELGSAIKLLAEKDQQLGLLIERIKQLEKMIYGSRSTKRNEPVDPALLLPFPGLKELLDSAVERAEQRVAKAEERATQQTPKAPSKPKGRRSLSAAAAPDLPRVRNERALSDSERSCDCGGSLCQLRQEVSRRLEQMKVFYVEEHVTTYYACSNCERVVSTKPDREAPVVEGGMLGNRILADLVYQRFGNHTPYNRLARELEYLGIPIDRTVVGRNVLRCGELLEPIYSAIRNRVRASFLVQLDDTPVVVREGKKKGRKTGRIWVYRSPDGNVVFDFCMNRSHKGPKSILGAYRGLIQADCYSGHDFLFIGNDFVRIELACWAHVVRKFRDARDNHRRVGAEFDAIFAVLHQIEIEAKEMSPSERLLYRAKHAPPVLKEMKAWLDARSMSVLPKSAMGKAISYTRNHWQALQNYLLDGRVTDITNNGAERALRRVAVGRKNWIYIGAEDAGRPAAVLMSILQTCAEQGVNPVDYLRDVLVQIGEPGSSSRIDQLVPSSWKHCPEAKARVLALRAKDSEVMQQLDQGAGQLQVASAVAHN